MKHGFVAALAGLVAGCGAIAAPPTAPPPLEAYGALPEVEQVVLSADGQRVAYLGSLAGRHRLFVMDGTGKLIWSSLTGDLKARDLQWAGNSVILLGFSKTAALGSWMGGKSEIYTDIAINIANSNIIAIFRGKLDVRPFLLGNYGVRNIEGRWYGFFQR